MGSSRFGYALIYIGPHIAAIVLQGLSQDRLKQIAAQRQALIEQWGHEVLGDKDDQTGPGAAQNLLQRPGSGGPVQPR